MIDHREQIAELQLKLEVLLESIPVKCVHYAQQHCRKVSVAETLQENYLRPGRSDHYPSCGGSIDGCDLISSGTFGQVSWLESKRGAHTQGPWFVDGHRYYKGRFLVWWPLGPGHGAIAPKACGGCKATVARAKARGGA